MIIVVGSGVAGLAAAWTASTRGPVTLVTKGSLHESNTYYAQGGVAAALFAGDSVSSHVSDTIAVGCGLNDRGAVQALCAEGPERLRELIQAGVSFDLTDGHLAGGLEAAHSFPRILHAGGDATGAAIERGLIGAARSHPIGIREFTVLRGLLVENCRVVGVEVQVADEHTGLLYGAPEQLLASAVILATGGAGQLYAHTTNPLVATGDGVAAAWRAGAVIGDPEFYQFHPTALAVPGNFLISEAVRGEGALLRDRSGRRFMLDVHPDAELAPRDVVARAIAQVMRENDGAPVLLDATGLGAGEGTAAFLARRFPTIDRVCREHGLDWASEPIPVTPAAHYWMGGVRTDRHGRTSLPGLYAAGEVACSGVHGANRLASNSLLEGLVFGRRAAVTALEGTSEPWPSWESVALADAVPPARLQVPAQRASSAPMPATISELGAVVMREELQHQMWTAAGVERTGDQLQALGKQLDAWRGPTSPTGGSEAEQETANLLDVARILTAAALARTESRGAHHRGDYPETDPAQARHTHLVRAQGETC